MLFENVWNIFEWCLRRSCQWQKVGWYRESYKGHRGDPNCEGHGRETLAISSLQHGLSFVLLAPQLLLEETNCGRDLYVQLLPYISFIAICGLSSVVIWGSNNPHVHLSCITTQTSFYWPPALWTGMTGLAPRLWRRYRNNVWELSDLIEIHGK